MVSAIAQNALAGIPFLWKVPTGTAIDNDISIV